MHFHPFIRSWSDVGSAFQVAKLLRKQPNFSSVGNPAAMSGSSLPLVAGVSLPVYTFIQNKKPWLNMSSLIFRRPGCLGETLWGFPSHPRGWFGIIVYP